MVTAFLHFGALERLQTGYKPQAAPMQAQKNPPRRVFLCAMNRITWSLQPPVLQVLQVLPVLQQQRLPLGQTLQQQEHLPLGQRLWLQVPLLVQLFCSWLCQNRRPGPRPARSRPPKRSRLRVDCHLEGST
jgi:hypothetical protein